MNIPVRGIEDAKAGSRREHGLSEEHKEGQSCPNSRQGGVWLGLVGHVKYLYYPKFVGKDLSAVERSLSQGLWYMKKRRNVKKS